MNRFLLLISMALGALLVAGCSPLIEAEQPVVLDSVVLDEFHSLGQTFHASFAGMNGIEIYLTPLENASGEIQLTLQNEVQGQNLGRASLSVAEISAPGFYRFPLPPQADSSQNGYYLLLRLKGGGRFAIGSAAGESYLDGALYQDNQPDPQRQMAFRLSYHAPRLALGLAGEMLLWAWYLLLAGFLFVLPGWALLDLAFPHPESLPWPVRLTGSAGAGLALYPVLMALTNAAGLQLGAFYAWIPPVLSALYLGWRWLRRRKSGSLAGWQKPRVKLPGVVLLVVSALLVAGRFWAIRSLPAPLWGDSLQHAEITQLILDNRGLFTSWEPYAPYQSFNTHFGFSAFAALFTWLSGLDSTSATLWVGQIVNVIAILGLYPLAARLAQGKADDERAATSWAGIGALLAAGLLSPLPAYYLNWGRYAQLAGQAILPVALWLLWAALEAKPDEQKRRPPWRLALLAGVVLAGMTLSYLRMPFYYAVFVLLLLLAWGWPRWRFDLRSWLRAALPLAEIALVALLLFLPWLPRLSAGNLDAALEAGIAAAKNIELVRNDLLNWKTIFQSTPRYLVILSCAAAAWALLRKEWMAAAVILWPGLLTAYMAGSLLRLPGANMLQTFAIMIALYIPVGLLVGWLTGRLAARKQPWLQALWGALIVGAAIYGVDQQRSLVDAQFYSMVTHPDARAMQWIEANTPAEASFLVQSFVYSVSVAGSDAGWWIPLLAGRGNNAPPQYAMFAEAPASPETNPSLLALVETLEQYPLPVPEALVQLCASGISHVYNGQQQGRVGFEVQPLFDPSALRNSPEIFERLYARDRVEIFALRQEACEQP